MKIISWNVAGLRACLNKGLDRFFYEEDADIYCFEESKVLDEQNPFHPPFYNEYLFPAKRKGYSGVIIYSKIKPLNIKYGIDDEEYDSEGRVITLEFDKFFLVAAYVPNSKRELERLESRMRFEDLMRNYLIKLKEKKHVIYCGDLNVAHQEIDIKNPSSNHHSAGFTDQEREKFSKLLESGFIDTFRYLRPSEIKYTWWSYIGNARSKDVGWRIDYFVVDKDFIKNVKNFKTYSDILGSDHCPIGIEIDI